MTNHQRSFLKWAGGKGQFLEQIIERLPQETGGSYYEPFLGSGVVFFNIPKHFDSYFLSDLNPALINAHDNIHRNYMDVYRELLRFGNTEEEYYELREEYNQYNPTSMGNCYRRSLRIAALFIYLNKTGWRGLYRQNRSGKLNTPFGHYRTINYLDASLYQQISLIYNRHNFILRTGFYSEMLLNAKRGDFVYLDPPYFPTTKSGGFTEYMQPFTTKDQIDLKYCLDELTRRGVRWMLSNSYCREAIQLYEDDYKIEAICGQHRIANSKGDSKVTEILVTNY